ncbi:AAA family ATPase [Parabacteroides sp. OttesenSCG-928-K15]|nr:AAA family ATPase [Parabacteroides sp. OttesenSCG-928-K15]
MDKSKKLEIIYGMQEYAKAHNLSQEAIGKQTGINVGYINALMRGKDNVNSVIIKDSYYKKIADVIGIRCEKVYWDTIQTPQYEMILEELIDAKQGGREKMIIGDPGCGKTYTLKEFRKAYPADTYCITVSSLHSITDIISELCDLVGVMKAGGSATRIKRLHDKMESLKLSGSYPIVILDESENLRPSQLRMVKALYDALTGYCPIVMIGTDQLLRKIERLREKDEDGIPQLYRRFKAGRRELRRIDKEKMFAPFLESIEDEEVKLMVMNLADNYGELNKFLEPALRESDEMGIPLTGQLYRNLYKI